MAAEEDNGNDKALEFARKFKADMLKGVSTGEEEPAQKKAKISETQLPPRANPPPRATNLPPRAPAPTMRAPVQSGAIKAGASRPEGGFERPQITPRPAVQSANTSNKLIIEVSSKQLENELLTSLTGWKENKFLKDVDYVVNDDIIILYLSLEFHKIRPGYIERRVSGMRQGSPSTLRILLFHVDTGDWEKSLAELNAFCLFQNLTLVIGWSFAECASYLQYLKTIRNATMIKSYRTEDREVVNDKFKLQERASQFLRAAPRMDKTTASKLMARHLTVKKIVSLSSPELQQVDRMGAVRARTLVDTLEAPFVTAHDVSQFSNR